VKERRSDRWGEWGWWQRWVEKWMRRWIKTRLVRLTEWIWKLKQKYQTEIYACMHKNSPFWIKKCKHFLGRGTPPLQTPLPSALTAPRSSRLRRSSSTWHPKKPVVTALQTDKKHCRCDTLLRTDINIHRRNSLSQKKLTVCKLLQNLSWEKKKSSYGLLQ